MSIIIFIIILSLLIIVHELGHFSVAKKFGIRVDEFGIGFPPRAKKLFTWKDTLFTLNWLPFGGFVKIFGENPEQLELSAPQDSFQSKSRGIQASVLVAGVVGNFLFAWLLFSLGFITGLNYLKTVPIFFTLLSIAYLLGKYLDVRKLVFPLLFPIVAIPIPFLKELTAFLQFIQVNFSTGLISSQSVIVIV